MADDTYNGWTNRETWALMLWINNDEGMQEMAREAVRGAEYPSEALRDLADMWFTRAGWDNECGGQWPNELADAAADIGSLWRVNFREASASILDDISEDVA